MAFQRVAFAAAIILLAQHPQDASGFTVNPLAAATHSSVGRPSTSVRMADGEPSASEKAAELRKKAEEAKRKAEELKKVAETKAAAAMDAVKKANDRASAEAKKKPSPPTTPKAAAPAATKASGRAIADPEDGAIVPINAENIEFTSGVIGGALALVLGASPVLAVVAAVAANYVSKKDDLGEIAELVQGVSKASLSTLNWFGKLDSKYSLLGKLNKSLDESIESLKTSEGGSAETIKKIEDATRQIKQLADEIDLLEGGKQALGAVGEVIETSIDKAVSANQEYKLTDRAAGAAKKAIEKAKDANN